MDNDSVQPRRGPGSILIDTINTTRNIRVAGAIAGGLGPLGLTIIGAIVGIFFLTLIFTNITGGEAANIPSGNGNNQTASGPSSDISTCYFYRGGDTVPAAKISNPQLSSFVADVAIKTSVPSSIIAGVMRVESGDRLSNSDEAYFNKGYDYHTSGVAYGIMQFTPDTFSYVFSSNKEILNTVFGKDSVETGLTGNGVSGVNVFRIYSIKDSIIAAALKIKADKKSINGDGPWDEATIRKIAERYYGTNADGTTNYPGNDGSIQNYGSDVWKSYSGCQPTPIIASSCPIPNGQITCGSITTPINNCSHCGRGYEGDMKECSPGYEAIKYAIDIATQGTKTGDAVYLPQIKGHNILWSFAGQSEGGSGFIQAYTGTDMITQEKYYLEFHHTLAGSGASSERTHLSGDAGGNICGNLCGTKPHLHLELGSGNARSSSNYLDAALYLCR